MTSMAARQHEEYTSINLDADSGRTGRLDFVLEHLDLPAGSRLLDIGCGPGVQFIGHTRKHKITGIDVSEEALRKAHKNGYETIRHNLADPLPIDSATMDAVVLSDILEHLMDPLALLTEAHRVLHPKGYAIISVPNHFYLLARLRILFGKGIIQPWANHQEYEDWNYFHIRFFRWVSLLSILDKANFDLEVDLTDRFMAPLPRWLRIPVMRQGVEIIRHITRYHWRDVWSLHLLVICRPRLLKHVKSV